jgi:hypothetical protein
MCDMLSALARLERHSVEFGCEVDTIDAVEWDHIANEFDDLRDDQMASYSAGQWGNRASHLLLRQHGKPVAGARVAISPLPVLARGLAVLRFGPFWHRRGEPADLTMYRAALGAIVQEYSLHRGHYLTVIPHPHSESYLAETLALLEFGFRSTRQAGEFDYCPRSPARIMGGAVYAMRALQRTMRFWRLGA